MKKYLVTSYESVMFDETTNTVESLNRKHWYDYIATASEDGVVIFENGQIDVKAGDIIFLITEYAEGLDSQDKRYIKILH